MAAAPSARPRSAPIPSQDAQELRPSQCLPLVEEVARLEAGTQAWAGPPQFPGDPGVMASLGAIALEPLHAAASHRLASTLDVRLLEPGVQVQVLHLLLAGRLRCMAEAAARTGAAPKAPTHTYPLAMLLLNAVLEVGTAPARLLGSGRSAHAIRDRLCGELIASLVTACAAMGPLSGEQMGGLLHAGSAPAAPWAATARLLVPASVRGSRAFWTAAGSAAQALALDTLRALAGVVDTLMVDPGRRALLREYLVQAALQAATFNRGPAGWLQGAIGHLAQVGSDWCRAMARPAVAQACKGPLERVGALAEAVARARIAQWRHDGEGLHTPTHGLFGPAAWQAARLRARAVRGFVLAPGFPPARVVPVVHGCWRGEAAPTGAAGETALDRFALALLECTYSLGDLRLARLMGVAVGALHAFSDTLLLGQTAERLELRKDLLVGWAQARCQALGAARVAAAREAMRRCVDAMAQGLRIADEPPLALSLPDAGLPRQERLRLFEAACCAPGPRSQAFLGLGLHDLSTLAPADAEPEALRAEALSRLLALDPVARASPASRRRVEEALAALVREQGRVFGRGRDALLARLVEVAREASLRQPASPRETKRHPDEPGFAQWAAGRLRFDYLDTAFSATTDLLLHYDDSWLGRELLRWDQALELRPAEGGTAPPLGQLRPGRKVMASQAGVLAGEVDWLLRQRAEAGPHPEPALASALDCIAVRLREWIDTLQQVLAPAQGPGDFGAALATLRGAQDRLAGARQDTKSSLAAAAFSSSSSSPSGPARPVGALSSLASLSLSSAPPGRPRGPADD